MKYKSLFSPDTPLTEMQETINKLYSGIGVQLDDVKPEIAIITDKERIQTAKKLRKMLLAVSYDIKKLRAALLDFRIATRKQEFDIDIISDLAALNYEERAVIKETVNSARDKLKLISDTVRDLRLMLLDYQKVVKAKREKNQYI